MIASVFCKAHGWHLESQTGCVDVRPHRVLVVASHAQEAETVLELRPGFLLFRKVAKGLWLFLWRFCSRALILNDDFRNLDRHLMKRICRVWASWNRITLRSNLKPTFLFVLFYACRIGLKSRPWKKISFLDPNAGGIWRSQNLMLMSGGKARAVGLMTVYIFNLSRRVGKLNHQSVRTVTCRNASDREELEELGFCGRSPGDSLTLFSSLWRDKKEGQVQLTVSAQWGTGLFSWWPTLVCTGCYWSDLEQISIERRVHYQILVLILAWQQPQHLWTNFHAGKAFWTAR